MLECKRCGYQWMPKTENRKPKTCPGCKSPYWEKPISAYWESVRAKNKSDKTDDAIDKMASALRLSNYSMSAAGFRGVGHKELCEILKILFKEKDGDPTSALRTLYNNHPDTIAMDISINGGR